MTLKYTKLEDGSYEVGDESEIDGNGYIKSCPVNVNIPEFYEGAKVTTIAKYAFKERNIRSVTFPSSIKYIKDGAFDRNSISQLTIPILTEELGNFCFAANIFSTVTIPEHVKIIGCCPFGGNSNLNSKVDNKNQYFCTDIYGSLLTKNQTILIQAYPKVISLTIPPTVHTILTQAIDQKSNFKYITIYGDIKSFSQTSIFNLPNLETIYYFGKHSIPSNALKQVPNVKIYVCDDYDSSQTNSIKGISSGFCYRNKILCITKINNVKMNYYCFVYCFIL